MPRCHECSEVVSSERNAHDFDCLRIWPSGMELIRSAESGCDLCSFVRKEIEKVSTANLARIRDKPQIVLRNDNEGIVLDKDRIHFHNPEFSSHFLRVASRSSCHHIDTPALVPPYDPVLRAHELLKACMLGEKDEHNLCKPSEMDPSGMAASLPRRLLDLSHGDVILTLDTQEWIARNRATANELATYCTLSYRWGQEAPACMLRTQPIADRIMFLVSLPQTFQDAITVARGLGIRFLWIDALCIIQPSAHGDDTNWKREGPRMWLVYQNAICTISATCSEQPNDGFLHKVGIDYNPPCSISGKITSGMREPLVIPTDISPWYASVVLSNLNRRGWVAQERLLSRRILHFSEEGVFWECQGSESDDPDNDSDTNEEISRELEIGDDFDQHHASFMVLGRWLAFIELYSLSEFTLQTDRLIALSSIARCVPTRRFGQAYYAGIWGSHLSRCLSWKSRTPCSVKTREECLTVAPSWSWASVAGGIEYCTRDFGAHSEALAEMIDVQTVLAEASNQYGNLTKASLKLRAPTFSLSLPTNKRYDPDFDDPIFSSFLNLTAELAWDEVQDPHIAMKVYTVVLVGIVDGWPESIMYDAIVVSRLPSTVGEDGGASCEVYRRIGHLYYWLGRSRGATPDHPDKQSELRLLRNKLFPNAASQTIVVE